MRTVDRRTRVSRRVVLRGGAAAVPVALIAGEVVAPAAAWADDAKVLAPATMVTLAKMARDIYPHDKIADVFYVKAVGGWDAKAGADPAVKDMIEGGVARLNQDAQDRHNVVYVEVAWEADRVDLLKAIEQTAFFNKVRAGLVVSLYNQPEIWPKFGYEGSSAEYGGYIHRGFNDINWLPAT